MSAARSGEGGRSRARLFGAVVLHLVAVGVALAASLLAASVLFVHVARDDLQWERLAALTGVVAFAAFVAAALVPRRWWLGLLAAAGSVAVGLIQLAAWLHSGLGVARLVGFAALGLVAHPLVAWLAARGARRLRTKQG